MDNKMGWTVFYRCAEMENPIVIIGTPQWIKARKLFVKEFGKEFYKLRYSGQGDDNHHPGYGWEYLAQGVGRKTFSKVIYKLNLPLKFDLKSILSRPSVKIIWGDMQPMSVVYRNGSPFGLKYLLQG